MISLSRGRIDAWLQRNLGSYAESIYRRSNRAPAWWAIRLIILGTLGTIAINLNVTATNPSLFYKLIGGYFCFWWANRGRRYCQLVAKLDEYHHQMLEGVFPLDYLKYGRLIISTRKLYLLLGPIFSGLFGVMYHDLSDLTWLISLSAWVIGLHWATLFLPPVQKAPAAAPALAPVPSS